MFVVDVLFGEPLLFCLTVDEHTDPSFPFGLFAPLKVFALHLRVKSSGKAAQIQSRRAHLHTHNWGEMNTVSL